MALATRPTRNTKSHKKRSGRHHRHSDSYLKTYWPYIPMLLIVGLGLVVNTVWSHTNVLGANSDFSNTALLNATNSQRSADHETTLSLNRQLSSAAQAKANDMAARNYWSHNTPDGKTPWTFVTTAGYQYQTAGENLAYGFDTADDTVIGWMSSPEHRANILNTQYKDVGFGVAQAPDYQGQGPETIIVAEYGASAGAVAGANTSQAGITTTPTAKPVSRIQLLADGRAAWSTVAVSALAGAAITLFIIRHGIRFKRLVLGGEAFILHRPVLDIALVFVGTLAIIFVQASGTIH